jgi:glucose/arabinose dehydrogenase
MMRLTSVLTVGLGVIVVMFLFGRNSTAAIESESDLFLPVVIVAAPPEFAAEPSTALFDTVTDITHAGDSRLFVVERIGRIQVVQPDGSASTFLDITHLVDDNGFEQGMFGLAFHPDYANNGYFYVNYTGRDAGTGDLTLFLARYSVSADPDVAQPDSQVIQLQLSMAYQIHFGGGLRFSPITGLLYMGVGDNSEFGNGQEDNSPKGKILELNVAENATPVLNLAEPAAVDASYSIWGKGLRNPWRIAFDPFYGHMYIGDVGDREYEEIDIVPVGVQGLNFGWACMEGPLVLYTGGPCADLTLFAPPAYYYSHASGCSVIMGEVYYYNNDPAQQSMPLFSDLCSDRIEVLRNDDGRAYAEVLGNLPEGGIITFGRDFHGNIWVGTISAGPIYKLTIPPMQ